MTKKQQIKYYAGSKYCVVEVEDNEKHFKCKKCSYNQKCPAGRALLGASTRLTKIMKKMGVFL